MGFEQNLPLVKLFSDGKADVCAFEQKQAQGRESQTRDIYATINRSNELGVAK